jgi:nitrile hydratase subunit alpha
MTNSESTERIAPSPRAETLEKLLTERGLIDPPALDAIITTYGTNVGPLNGAKVVAKAWSDAEYRRFLLNDGTAAIKELGFIGTQTEHVVVVENTATSHHVVVCTLCSCYPWQLLGLPPSWYKDPAYRARG